MVLVKILKRKDAASIIVAILIAMIIAQPLNMLTSPIAGRALGLKDGQYMGYAPPVQAGNGMLIRFYGL